MKTGAGLSPALKLFERGASAVRSPRPAHARRRLLYGLGGNLGADAGVIPDVTEATASTPAMGPALRADPAELARSARAGGDEAFEELVRRLHKRVFRLAYQYLRDPDEAQDLTQEVFVHLYRNLHRYDPERPFEPWFWRVAGNVSATYRRRRRPEPLELPAGAAAPGRDADALSLELALATLDPGLRLPILLHYHADLPLDDVGAALGLTVTAVKSRLHRARAVLRRLLAEEPG